MSSGEKLEEILRLALEHVSPTKDELEKARRVGLTIMERLRGELAGQALKVTLEGSYAKGTVLKGRNEVDIFVHFDPSIPLEQISRATIGVSSNIISSLGGAVRLRYAEHPYVEGFLNQVRVNVVPCYAVDRGKWITAVDRTPYHTEYVMKNIRREQVGDVLLLKALLMASDLYGAEIRVGGFSGYVCELLILHYGSLVNLLKSAASWHIPVLLGPDSIVLREKYPNSPMILADPVDENRNAAASVTLENAYHLILLSRILLTRPKIDYFLKQPSPNGFRLERRELLAIFLNDVGEKSPDILWGEIRKTAEGISRCLAHHGFTPLRWRGQAEERSVVILFELAATELPQYQLHVGPPATHPKALEFIQKQLTSHEVAAGPWISGNRLYSLRTRAYTRAVDLLMQKLHTKEISVSKGLAEPLSKAKILTAPHAIKAEMDAMGLSAFLREFVEGCPNYMRVYRS